MPEKIPVEQLLDDGLVTVRQAAQFLGLSIASIYSLMARGELIYAKFGKSRRIPKRALIELAKKNIVIRQNT